MRKYPYKKLVVPKEVAAVGNGNLTSKMLKKVKTGGMMWTVAADAFNEMYDAAIAAGHKLRNVGDYRPLEPQLAMFKDRYEDKDTGRVPKVTRTYQGKTWYLKKGKAPSATPGTSNHGFGLAIDLGMEIKGKLESIGGGCLDWMCENAPQYGFYLQGSDPKSPEFEAWHWQYCLGDTPRGKANPTVPAASGAKDDGGDLEPGDNGPRVVKLQEALAKLGLYAGTADGQFDKVTSDAVVAYKKSKGYGAGAKAGKKVLDDFGIGG